MNIYNYNLGLVTRTFQPQSTLNTFNETRFVDTFALPLKKMIDSKLFKKVFVVVNIEEGNKYAELPDECGVYPSVFYIKKYFGEELEEGFLEVLTTKNWGHNAGSAQALTLGSKKLESLGFDYVMNWSAEMDIGKFDIVQAIEVAIEDNHDVVGFLREYWWQKYQWSVSQNTASIWRLSSLKKVGYFDSFCDLNDKSIKSKEFGVVPFLGMEDFHAMVKMIKIDPHFSWGMTKSTDPIMWKIKDNVSENKKFEDQRKIFRQSKVMNYYIEEVYGTDKYEDFLESFFTRRKIYQ